MFSHDSTENLLDNLESELTEMIELDTPKSKKVEKLEQIQEEKSLQEIEPENSIRQKREPPPVPARRRIQKSPLVPQNPLLITKNSIDKIEKNNENEIIQLQSLNSEHDSSMSSESQKISQASSKHNTVISINEKKKKNEGKSSIRVIHESEQMPDDTIFVIKHGTWADEMTIEKEIEDSQAEVVSAQKMSKNTSLDESLSKKQEKKKTVTKKKKEVSTTSVTTSLTSSSSESSSEKIPQPVKKSKKQKLKEKAAKKKSKIVSEVQTSCTDENASKTEIENVEMMSSNKAIGIFINSMGSTKYRKEFKGLKVKISFYNEDNAKQIGETIWTKNANYNNDFYNFKIIWNENLRADLDFKRLREIYNNIIIFFEVINSDAVSVCWAFVKLFSPSFTNIDKKLKLQLFEYQGTAISCFPLFGNKKSRYENVSIYEQWQMTRKKFPSVLNISLKDVNLSPKNEELEAQKEVKVTKIKVLSANDNSKRHWRKIPGQACKVPNKIFHKIQLQDKGSLIVKFSLDGHFLAFTEVSKFGHILHIHKFPEMKEVFMMLEHSDIIHDIDWKKQKQYDCHHVVSASADFTAIVWKIYQDSYTYSILPHPSSVYASKFLQTDDFESSFVVTACRDNFIRIWKLRLDVDKFELMQELKHPKVSTFTYITSIVTRNSDLFYSSSSTGDVIEWISNDKYEYSLNRHFQIDEIRGRIISSMELNSRGNKICLRVQDCNSYEVSNAIYVIGIATGTLTQKFSQFDVHPESQGRLKISPCCTQIYSTSGSNIYHYQVINGSIVTSEVNKKILNIHSSLGEKGFISSMDYHLKDFFLACAVYGGNPSSIIIFSYETNELDPIEVMKMGSQEAVLQKSLETKQIGSYSDIIKRLDQVFLAPIASQSDLSSIQKVQDLNHQTTEENNTFTVQTNSKRSKTYTVSQGPATFTIQKGGTYEIQKNEGSDEDETTISESLN